MKKPIHVLFVEDDENDQLLLLRELQRGDFEVSSQRVETAEDLQAALVARRWDLILSDYSLPTLDAPGALRIIESTGLDTPVIVISGTIGEDTAVEVLKAGACDFILKGHLARLIPAVQRELREADVRHDKRKAERAAQQAEMRFRRIVETAQEGIWMVDTEGRTTYVNDRMAEILGETPANLLSVPILQLIDEDYRAPIAGQLMRSASAESSSDRVECRILRSDGMELWGSVAINAIDDGAGRPLGHLAMVVDVTGQRKLQEQLIVSDRMASVGALAAGVAHEINNPLSVILANLHLATDEIEKLVLELNASARTVDLHEEMRDARDATERVRCIVRDLKIFSRSQEAQIAPMDVQTVLDSSLRMAWNEIRHRARITREYAKIPLVDGSDSRLGQVFLNLITNAAHAMAEGAADQNELCLRTRVDDLGRVVVEISDSGMGMSPEVQRRIFTPFFTTKPVGVGTGLGLAICRQIVDSLNGEISVESRVGKGSTFRVSLPRSQSTIPATPRPAPARVPAPRRARILVVDDEAIVGSTVRRLLASEHEIEVMDSAREVADHIAGGASYDLILCDLMMPEVTGMDLHALLSKSSPDQARRMIFITGGAFTPRARSFLSQVSNPRLEKPFEPVVLRNLVNTRLIEQPTPVDLTL